VFNILTSVIRGKLKSLNFRHPDNVYKVVLISWWSREPKTVLSVVDYVILTTDFPTELQYCGCLATASVVAAMLLLTRNMHRVQLDVHYSCLVPTPPGKLLRVLEFSLFLKVLESSGNQCMFWKFLEIWCQGPGKFLNLLCFKFDKFALRFVCVKLKNYAMLLTYSYNEKSAQRSRKHCVLAVVRWSQKFSPCHRPPSRWCGRGEQLKWSLAFTLYIGSFPCAQLPGPFHTAQLGWVCFYTYFA